MASYSVGVDYGTNSVRAVVVDTKNGTELGQAVYAYPSGKAGILLDKADPNVARQNPKDYIDGFMISVKQAVAAAKKARPRFSPADVVGVGVDTTGSTPIPVDRQGVPLMMQKKFAKNLAAYAWLWKDHTAYEEALAITESVRRSGAPYLKPYGGTYSSEWFWSKIWHCRKTAPAVFDAAYSWVELCDFVPAYVTGNTDPLAMKRSICAAGHKAMFSDAWGGLPDKKFLASLDPKLASLRDRLYGHAFASDTIAGYLTADVAKKTGLAAGIPVAVGAFDCHHGAVGVGVRPGTLVKTIGTSSCDCLVMPMKDVRKPIAGICGMVPGSILPGMCGLEAGQSAVGDIFNWFVGAFFPEEGGAAHVRLTQEADKLKPGESGLLALDWNNGNRNILTDPRLSGLMLGQTLHTSAAEMYRALIEATAFGALTIIKQFEAHRVPVKEVVACGGIAEKNPMLMQIYADILNRPLRISRSSQTCALGAAVFGAVVGGAHKDTPAAQKKMTGLKKTVYRPRATAARTYAELYELYRDLHDAFGTPRFKGDLQPVMKKLMRIREQARRRG